MQSNNMAGSALANYDSSDFQLQKIPEEQTITVLVQVLRELILADPKLKCPTDDEALKRFIRGRKYNVERAFQTIICFYKIFSSSSEMNGSLYPSALTGLLMTPDFITVSKVRSDGKQIVIVRIGLWNTKEFHPDKFLTSFVLTGSHLIRTSIETNIHGIHAVLDMKGFTLKHLRLLTPKRIKKTVAMLQDGFPVRIKGIHIVNNFDIVEILFGIAKPFLKEKLKKRMHFYGKNYQEVLAKALGPNSLPCSRGGNIPDEDYGITDFFSGLLAQDDYYKDLTSKGYGYNSRIIKSSQP